MSIHLGSKLLGIRKERLVVTTDRVSSRENVLDTNDFAILSKKSETLIRGPYVCLFGGVR